MINQEYCKKYKEKTGKSLIVYATSVRENLTAQIASDMLPYFIEQINQIPKTEEEVDILIESNGGDPIVIWRLVNIIRNRFKKFGVLVPYNAYSAATLFAMGADSIYIGDFGCLGPIDPQITITEGPLKKNFAYEDIVSYLDFTKNEVGLTEQEYLSKSYDHLLQKVEPAHIGFAKRSSSLALTLGMKLLMTHIDNEQEAKLIAEKLNKSFFSHAHSLSRADAKEIGLNILDKNKDVESIIWGIHQNLDELFKNKYKFNPIELYFSKKELETKALNTNAIPRLDLSNIQPQIAMNIYANAFNEKLIELEPITEDFVSAVIESGKKRFEYKIKLMINVKKTIDLNIIPSIIELEAKWE